MTRVLSFLLPIGLGCLLLSSCGEVVPSAGQLATAARSFGAVPKATGEVEIEWMGGGASAGAEKRAYAAFEWFDAGTAPDDRGQFRYSVNGADGSLHREIIAEPTADTRTGISVDATTGVAYFVGVVTFDSRHDANSGGESMGGESCADAGDEGSCADGAEGGGCEGGHDSGGCSGEDGCSGGSDAHAGPAHPPGSIPRVGEVVAVVVHDRATPGTNGDSITWSWFYGYEAQDKPEGAASTPEIGNSASWSGELCEKQILGGNIVIHAGSHR